MKKLNKDYFTSRMEYGGPLEIKVIMKCDDGTEKTCIGNIYYNDIFSNLVYYHFDLTRYQHKQKDY